MFVFAFAFTFGAVGCVANGIGGMMLQIAKGRLHRAVVRTATGATQAKGSYVGQKPHSNVKE
jgi:hypothetical protein